jgi:hypothetical protein
MKETVGLVYMTDETTLTVMADRPYGEFYGFYSQWHTQDLGVGGVSTNSVEDRGQRERGSGGSSPLIRGSNQPANEQNPYFD